jgi:hypothetical protein
MKTWPARGFSPVLRRVFNAAVGLRRDKLRPTKGDENGLEKERWEEFLAPHNFTCPGN